MKTLYLMRHGKAVPHASMFKDFERPLIPEGIKRTKKIAHWILETNEFPELIISSPATRALETANIVIKHLKNKNIRLIVEENLYNFEENSKIYLNILKKLPDDISSVMLVGHNPTISYFATTLLKIPFFSLSTSGIVVIKLPISTWKNIKNCQAEMKYNIAPKMISDE